MERRKITSVLLELFEYCNLEVSDFGMIEEALKVYAERKLDFVDTLLYAYHKLGKYQVYTFDKKLNRLLESTENLYE